MSDNNKKYVLSCGDSRYDKNKTKFILFFIIKKGPELGENLQLYKKGPELGENLQVYRKRDTDTGLCLWILRNI